MIAAVFRRSSIVRRADSPSGMDVHATPCGERLIVACGVFEQECAEKDGVRNTMGPNGLSCFSRRRPLRRSFYGGWIGNLSWVANRLRTELLDI